MARKSSSKNSLSKVQAENQQLKAENQRLKVKAKQSKDTGPGFNAKLFRRVGAIFFLVLAVVLLAVGNILFWTGNTIVKNDRYTQAVAPLIRDPVIQEAVANYTTKQIFANVDVSGYITSVLPPRADFLAPTLTNQLQTQTNTALQKVLANPNFQDKWNNVQFKSHDAFINTVGKYGSDGVINLNEVYQQLSGNLKDTKLSFLAGKNLPSKVGSIQVVSGEQIKILQKVINNIDAWRATAIVLFVISAVASVMLSFRRRRAIVRLSLFLSAMMLATLIALRIVRETIVGRVDPSYSEAVRHAVQIIFHPLVLQTVTLLLVSLLVALIAWIGGTSRSAAALKTRTDQLLAGKLHKSLFAKENSLTLGLGQSKKFLQWAIVGLAALVSLLVRLTPKSLLAIFIAMVVLFLALEALAAPAVKAKRT